MYYAREINKSRHQKGLYIRISASEKPDAYAFQQD